MMHEHGSMMPRIRAQGDLGSLKHLHLAFCKVHSGRESVASFIYTGAPWGVVFARSDGMSQTRSSRKRQDLETRTRGVCPSDGSPFNRP